MHGPFLGVLGLLSRFGGGGGGGSGDGGGHVHGRGGCVGRASFTVCAHIGGGNAD